MSRMTTAEYFALALRKCEGHYIHLKDAVRIMHYFGWETKSSTPDKILKNVHSRVYKHGRHIEEHPEDSLGIDFTESSKGLYRIQECARPLPN